jgi:4'-phosphopantetheinyl transferase
MMAYSTPMIEPLPHNLVHVVLTRQDDPAVHAHLPAYRSLLTEEERAREARYHFAADRERFVIGRALARLQLSRYLGGDPRAWRFETNGHGRPALVAAPGTPRLGFNISHTPGLVACVFAHTPDVGVDVEFTGRRLSQEIPERFFAPAEVADLRGLPAADQDRVFFDYWTLKEAYIKARGMGLALPLAHFAFRLSPPGAPTIAFDPEIPDDPSTWQFGQAWPTTTHRLGLAVRRPPGADLDVRIDEIVPHVDQ